MTPDITIAWNGEAIELAPESPLALAWLLENRIMPSRWTETGSLAMGWREADGLLDRAQEDGLRLV